MRALLELPPTFTTTRDSLRAVACYAIAPARKAATGRIGLRPVGEGFGTPPFDDGTRIVVEGDELIGRDRRRAPMTTVRAAATLLGVEPSADPGVGHDLPPFEPDAELTVDVIASRALSSWYQFGQLVIDRLAVDLPAGSLTEAQLWPEHFDLATVIDLGDDCQVNVGVSPGDAHRADPYLYVGPRDTTGLDDPYWNEPFGASLTHAALASVDDAVAFVRRGLDLTARLAI